MIVDEMRIVSLVKEERWLFLKETKWNNPGWIVIAGNDDDGDDGYDGCGWMQVDELSGLMNISKRRMKR